MVDILLTLLFGKWVIRDSLVALNAYRETERLLVSRYQMIKKP